MAIVVLDSRIINRIAAGEVVERPASVVKELVENSIDAGATEIVVDISNGGRNLITVTDNGVGIDKSELELALTRHATSKITDPELVEIKYLGFRGEALPAIASVSRMRLMSRTCSQERAWCLDCKEEKQDIEPVSMNFGTRVEVRDLFFATPNRLKFLKTERAETQYLHEILNRLAMSHSNIEFVLNVDGKKSFKYLRQQSLNLRLSEPKLLGKDFLHHSVSISIEFGAVKLTGYAGLPILTRGKSTLINIFVNNRPIQDNLIISAVRNAYRDFIQKDQYPITALYLEIPPDQVDVNVHPNKSEVRFQDKRLIYQLVFEGITQALSTKRCGEAIGTSPEFGKLIEKSTKDSDSLNDVEKNKFTPLNRSGSLFTRNHSFDQNVICKNNEQSQDLRLLKSPSLDTNSLKQENNLSKEQILIEDRPLGFARCQLYRTYIVAQTDDSVIFVDQHAAHERLVYEYIKGINSQHGIKRQSLLVPEVVELNQYEQERLLEFRDKLLKLGLSIDKLGDCAVLVREIPAILGGVCAKSLVKNLVDGVFEFGSAWFLDDKIKDICATIACHSSIRAGRELKVEEMNVLLRQMEATPNSAQCNHGRPTYIKITLKDIKKMFERS